MGFPVCLKCNMPILPGKRVVEWHQMRLDVDCAVRLGASLIASAIEGTPKLEDFALNILRHEYRARGMELVRMALSPSEGHEGQYDDYEVMVSVPCYYCGVELTRGEHCKVFVPKADTLPIIHLHTEPCASLFGQVFNQGGN